MFSYPPSCIFCCQKDGVPDKSFQQIESISSQQELVFVSEAHLVNPQQCDGDSSEPVKESSYDTASIHEFAAVEVTATAADEERSCDPEDMPHTIYSSTRCSHEDARDSFTTSYSSINCWHEDVRDSFSCRTSSMRRFPMYVTPVQVLLGMDRFRTHEDLMSANKLVEWREALGHVMFLSHTWLRKIHPDNKGVKFSLLQTILRQLTRGHLEVHGHWMAEIAYGNLFGATSVLRIPGSKLKSDLSEGFVWMDFMSIPQKEGNQQRSAVYSIASYITDCSYFVVLSGPWQHENGDIRDVRAWASRGWCRLEMLANALSPKAKPLIIAESSSAIVTHGTGGAVCRHWMSVPVGLGEFSVAADRSQVGTVLTKLIQKRQGLAEMKGDLLLYRMLHAMHDHMLSGTEIDCPREDTLDAWMANMHFVSHRDSAKTGLTPLRFAMLARRIDFMMKLLDQCADVEAPVRKRDMALQLDKGATILHMAVFVFDDPGLTRLLLQYGADPMRKADDGSTAMHYACYYGHCSNIDVLMTVAPSLADTAVSINGLPFVSLLVMGRAAALQHVMNHHPTKMLQILSEPASDGLSPHANVMVGYGDIDTLRIVLSVPQACNVDAVGPNKDIVMWLMVLFSQVRIKLSKRRNSFIEFMCYCQQTSALHIAAYQGNFRAVELLICARAEIGSTRHPYKMTPLHLAAMKGHIEITQHLLDAGVSAKANDAKGRSAAWWAASNGHSSLAASLQLRSSDLDGIVNSEKDEEEFWL